MDLGCLDFGCISVSDKLSNDTAVDSTNKESVSNEPISANSKSGKSRSPKGTSQSTLNALNKFTSQIKKPPHRKNSPINWFPRKKVDSYLKRKIRMLQEVDGMNLTLDETLGDTNPHYSRVLREKIAAREAAHKAMEARKAALVEASWCRILKAARIQNKEAESLLLKSEKAAAEAFEAATAMGVIMYDTPNCPQTHCQVETFAAVNGGGSTTHTITASFETAFEVDKEVAAAVKTAFIRLANCSSFSKDEFRDLLHKISENPDTGDSNQEISEFSSECESESGSELETVSQKNGFGSQDFDLKMPVNGMRQRKSKSSDKFSMTILVDMMLERLRHLQEEELSSLATIVATCGLNAALAKVENCKMHYPNSASDNSSNSVLNPRRMSSLGVGIARKANLDYFMDGPASRKHIESELPSLDKFLVKHMSKLEREVQEAKKSRMNESRKTTGENPGKVEDGQVKLDNEPAQSETTSDLGSVLVKHSSKFAKEIEEAKNNYNKFEIVHKNLEAGGMPDQVVTRRKEDVQDVPSLDKYLVKHVSRLEKEVQEARSRRNNDPIGSRVIDSTEKKSLTSVPKYEKNEISFSNRVAGKENIDLNKEYARFSENEHKGVKAGTEKTVDSLDKILVKPVHRLEREKMQALSDGNTNGYRSSEKKQIWNCVTDCDSLDKVLVKHVSRLEKEKMMSNASEEIVKVKRNTHSQMNEEGSLDQVLVKHKSRLEREKMATAAQEPEVQITYSVSRREARERELQETWGGLSLGNSIRPHLSKLERDKAAWIKAEEEERRQTMKKV
ncbi:hypothetical protein Pint_33773 [Pistacia integerrima]|uniref:Uncharacterized protein n=1 Tax=Pistacia integerrima TaxID=434235 RepID=A0ACC0X833_9ROSI|nr:hypothetical protein Pint_33773 [Pistacia integerrima]